MTIRQALLKIIYPLFRLFNHKAPGVKMVTNKNHQLPPVSFYSLSATLNSGEDFSFEHLRGKKVLVVNTASDCGYTPQYEDLQKLYSAYGDTLKIIAFPANNFKEQEKGTDEDIALFCQRNYGVSFPLTKKTDVIGIHQHPVFKWLSHQSLNGWNNQQPEWNFSKYLVDEKGILTYYFHPSISPLGQEVIEAIKA